MEVLEKMSESVYGMVKRNSRCYDCDKEIFAYVIWEPFTAEINGEKIHCALCVECIHNVYTVRNERAQEEPGLLAILANGAEVLSRELCSVCCTEDCINDD